MQSAAPYSSQTLHSVFYVVNQPCQVHLLLGGIRTAEEKGAEILDGWILPSMHSLHLHSEPSI